MGWTDGGSIFALVGGEKPLFGYYKRRGIFFFGSHGCMIWVCVLLYVSPSCHPSCLDYSSVGVQLPSQAAYSPSSCVASSRDACRTFLLALHAWNHKDMKNGGISDSAN